MSVYGIMGNKDLCHTFRTCARPASCTPNIPVGVPLDTNLINDANKGYRAELISNDATNGGKLKWRWQVNAQTTLRFTKVGSTLYADLKFTPDSQNAGENNVKNPGNDVSGIPSSGSNVQPSTPLGSSVCGTRFEVQCQEVNPRHAFEELTSTYEWVDYNKSSYKFVAKLSLIHI